ncbi:MAG: hypothetical protein ABR920_16270 [Terriglobales bacterium]
MLDWAKAIHQAVGIESPRLFILIFACLGFFLFGSVAWIIDHGYRVKLREEHAALSVNPAPSVAATSSATEKVKPLNATPTQRPKKKTSPRPQIGNDNTLVNVPIPPSMGDGNTFVGPTDANGNTIYNKGGTAIGKDACADSSSVAIGAGANAGSCPAHGKQPDHPIGQITPDPQEKQKPN